MGFKLYIAVLLSTSLQVSDCLHYYKTPALDNQFSNFNITAPIPSDGINGSLSMQEALLFKQHSRQYITFNFKGKGNAQLQCFYEHKFTPFKVEIGGGTSNNEVSLYGKNNNKKNSTNLTNITSEHEYSYGYTSSACSNSAVPPKFIHREGFRRRSSTLGPGFYTMKPKISRYAYRQGNPSQGKLFSQSLDEAFCILRSFYIYKKNLNTTYRVYVGLGSDPRTNHVVYADFGRLLSRRNIYYILISTATNCLGEWQFAAAGQMFGGCGNGTVCSNTDTDLECNDDEESKETGLIGTCTPDLVDFSTVTFGNGTFSKATQHSTRSYLCETSLRGSCLVATIDRTLTSLVVW